MDPLIMTAKPGRWDDGTPFELDQSRIFEHTSVNGDPMPLTATDLAALSARIVEAVHPELIILFGSHARGDAAPDSDVDLLVIESEPFGPFRSRFQEIARLERAMESIPIATNLLVYSSDEVEQLKSSANHVVARALREGKVLHARS